MSDFKDSYWLHPEHKDFVPGQTPLRFETLPTHIKTPRGCLIPTTITVISLIIVLGFTGLMIVRPYVLNYFFANHSQEITVEVTECSVSTGTTRKLPDYTNIQYRYPVQDITYIGYGSFYGQKCDRYALGVSLPATHLLPDPSQSRLVGAIDKETPDLSSIVIWLVILSAILFYTFPSFLLLTEYLAAREMYPRLQSQGQLRPGKIVAISRLNSNPLLISPTGDKALGLKDRNTRLELEYEFEAPDGRVLRGYTKVYVKDLVNKYLRSIGTRVVILYANDRTYMMM